MSLERPAGLFHGRRAVLAGLILLFALDAMIRWRLREMPLERDEGEYGYAAQLLLHGESFYKHAYNTALKFPGTVGAYALSMAAFGQTAAGIHSGVILVSLATAWLVFMLTRRICGEAAGLVGAGTFILLSTTPLILGLAAHATHFVMLPALAGILLLQNLEKNTSVLRIFVAGLFLGLAVLMKQSGAPFGLFAAYWICRDEPAERQWRRVGWRLAWLAAGGVLPLLITMVVVAVSGDLAQFWFWGFRYAGSHGTVFHWTAGVAWMFRNLSVQFMAGPALWSCALLGLAALFFVPALKGRRGFVAGFAAGSFLAVCPGWYFRGHYFIQLLPAAGLLAGIAFHALRIFFSRFPGAPKMFPALIFTVVFASMLVQWNGFYFRMTPFQASRETYSTNPFPEAVEVGRYLAGHCAPGAEIIVLGSEPEIYFYSHRRAASAYICTYPLMEPQPFAPKMREEMMHDIERADPAYVVFVNVPSSWKMTTAPLNTDMFDWFEKYWQERLEFVGYTTTLPDSRPEYHWFDSPQPFPPPAEYLLAIFKRK